MSRPSQIVQCPACGAKTKVQADPARVSIRCPRCKAEVMFAEAVVRPGESKAVDAEHGANVATQAGGTGTQSARRAKNKAPSADYVYPDHTFPLVRKLMVAGLALATLATVVFVYLHWNQSVTEKYQDYFKNIRDSIAAHKQCLALMKSGFDLDGEVNRDEYRDARAQITFLQQQRARLPAPSDLSDESLVKEESRLQEALVTAERQSNLGFLTQAPTEPNKSASEKGADHTSSKLSSSSLVSTRAESAERRPLGPAHPVGTDAVIVVLPGISKDQLSEDLLQRFASLADRLPGRATPEWAGDLLKIHVQPVADLAKFAMRIRFGQLLFYSSKDRSLTLQLGTDANGDVGNIARDPASVVIAGLKQREDRKKLTASLKAIRTLKAYERQAEIAAALEAIVGDTSLDAATRESALKLLPTAAGRDCISFLGKQLDDSSALIRGAALEQLVELKSVEAAGIIARKWGKMDPSRVTRALINLGPGVETVVLPYLNNNDNNLLKAEVCKVLQEVGTSQSLKPLSDVINDKSQSPLVISAAKDAMKSILERK